MLKEYLKENIQFAGQVSTWQQAIRMAAEPMKARGDIKEGYIEAMIQNVLTNGPYIIIMPHLALPHARPETGVNCTGMSFLKLEKPVVFPEEKPVTVIIVLAAKGEDTHLELLAELTDILMDEDKLKQLFAGTRKQEILELMI